MKLWESDKLMKLIKEAYKKNAVFLPQTGIEKLYSYLTPLEDPKRIGFLFLLAKKRDQQMLETELNLLK